LSALFVQVNGDLEREVTSIGDYKVIELIPLDWSRLLQSYEKDELKAEEEKRGSNPVAVGVLMFSSLRVTHTIYRKHVRLFSFLGAVCAALLFFSTR